MRAALQFFTFVILSVAFLLGAAPAAAQIGRDPFVFVMQTGDQGQDGRGLAWWLLQMISRPTGTSVSGVPLAGINAALVDPMQRWCYANAFTVNSFVSPYRHIQAQIEESLRTHGASPFRASGAFTGEGALDAVVGNFESCDGGAGTFLLITDRAQPTPQVIYVHVFTDWRRFIWLDYENGTLRVGSCFECGHVEGLFYDRGRRRFYWQNLGD